MYPLKGQCALATGLRNYYLRSLRTMFILKDDGEHGIVITIDGEGGLIAPRHYRGKRSRTKCKVYKGRKARFRPRAVC